MRGETLIFVCSYGCVVGGGGGGGCVCGWKGGGCCGGGGGGGGGGVTLSYASVLPYPWAIVKFFFLKTLGFCHY